MHLISSPATSSSSSLPHQEFLPLHNPLQLLSRFSFLRVGHPVLLGLWRNLIHAAPSEEGAKGLVVARIFLVCSRTLVDAGSARSPNLRPGANLNEPVGVQADFLLLSIVPVAPCVFHFLQLLLPASIRSSRKLGSFRPFTRDRGPGVVSRCLVEAKASSV